MLGSEHHYYEKKYDLEFAGEALKGTVITNSLPQLRNYDWGIWAASRAGKSITYKYQETYSGAPGPITRQLLLEGYCQVNRIDQIWNDATAKDCEIRAFSEASNTYYSLLQDLAGNTSTSETLQLGQEYKYPMGGRLDFVHENFTNGKIMKIIVQVDEL